MYLFETGDSLQLDDDKSFNNQIDALPRDGNPAIAHLDRSFALVGELPPSSSMHMAFR